MELQVEVYYEGRPLKLPRTGTREPVTVNGVPGTYIEEIAQGGRFHAAILAWEYAPDSWAMVQTSSDRNDPGSERLRSALVEVAEAVAPGGESVGLPFRVGESPSLPKLATADEVGIRHGTNGVAAVDAGRQRSDRSQRALALELALPRV